MFDAGDLELQQKAMFVFLLAQRRAAIAHAVGERHGAGAILVAVAKVPVVWRDNRRAGCHESIAGEHGRAGIFLGDGRLDGGAHGVEQISGGGGRFPAGTADRKAALLQVAIHCHARQRCQDDPGWLAAFAHQMQPVIVRGIDLDIAQRGTGFRSVFAMAGGRRLPPLVVRCDFLRWVKGQRKRCEVNSDLSRILHFLTSVQIIPYPVAEYGVLI